MNANMNDFAFVELLTLCNRFTRHGQTKLYSASQSVVRGAYLYYLKQGKIDCNLIKRC